ncbi:chemotaxis protein CheA [Parasulfuritortus cantonensis]|uniref:Chemotaxis protein CheA n=1 Tax=Parasulfuritortus cantonensis TaxID=2528202 RepID=A0A4R1BIM9_9PROT|nr:chemotaxis protein CheW [Parasulfuritortus cantonensis]TCJ17146.1 chemotaxis protein CheA [Parasulfuritortus cantonensis]
MTVDMSQFYQVFFDEAGEHLANMESLLLDLDVEAPDLEDLNAIFRAAHSIKGGSGTFGFTDMTSVTHILETLLDKLRKQELALRPEMVDAFLAAGDVLRAQLEHHQGGPEADPDSIQAVCATLESLATGGPAASPAESAPADTGTGPGAAAGPVRELAVSFDLPAEVAGDPAAVANLVDGFCETVACDVLARPSAEAPRFRAHVTTTFADAELRDLLAFYADAGTIAIEPAGAAAAIQDDSFGLFDDAPGVPVGAAEDDGFGFFDSAPGAPAQAAPPEDAGFGFFDAAPGAPAAEAADDSFGLFDDAPGKPEFSHATPVKPGDSPAAIEAEGYGLFIDAPAGMGLFPGAPGSRTAAAAAAPAASNFGRRASDQPSVEVAKGGRRETDKTVTSASAEASSIRVSVDKVDQLINLVGELVITQAMIADAAGYLDPIQAEKLISGIDLLARNTRDLQESVMSIRMLPMSMVFSRFPRVVRDLAGKLNKQVDLKTVGENTELDKSLIEKITDPLTHLIRNSLDHGLETPDRRVAAGKPAKGTITLKASHQGGNIVIEVLDDGAGLNRERILAKAREKGMNVHDGMSDGEVWQLIMAPGFSTAEVVTDVSGRGVGMDVVKKNIEGLGGRVELESSPGHGTRIAIRLPLTLAILDGMSVGVDGDVFIVPLTAIVESLQPQADDIKTMAGNSRVIHIRGEYLPIIPLTKVFGEPEPAAFDNGIIVVVESEEGKAALFVDALLGQHQVVIKSLEANYRKVPGISGATIMGDGNVALILDIAAVTRIGLDHPAKRMAA